VRGREAPGGSPTPPGRVGRTADLTGELLGGAQGGRPPEPDVLVSWAAMHENNSGNQCRGSKGKREAGRAVGIRREETGTAPAAGE
jgi:hypothetical protein